MKRRLLILSVDGLNSETYNNISYPFTNIRKIAEEGGRIKNVKTIFPSVTWAVHCSSVTGFRPDNTGIIGNSVYSRSKGKILNYFEPQHFTWDKDVKTDSLFSLCRRNGLKTAAICWPLTQGADEIDYNIPEFYVQEHFEAYAAPEYWRMLKDSGIPVEKYAAWSIDHQKGALQDHLTNQILLKTLAETDADVLFAHYLSIDSFLHDYGKDAPEVMWVCGYVDYLIGTVINYLNAAGCRESTDLIVFSDHGHSDFQYYVHANAHLKNLGLYNRSNPSESDYIAVSNGGCYFVYRLKANDSDNMLTEYFSGMDWVVKAVKRDDFDKIGFPSYESDTQPNLLIVIKPGFCGSNSLDCGENFISLPTKAKSTHGYLAEEPDMLCFMNFCGPSFIKNEIEIAEIIDIPATAAKLLGLDYKCEGKPLDILL